VIARHHSFGALDHQCQDLHSTDLSLGRSGLTLLSGTPLDLDLDVGLYFRSTSAASYDRSDWLSDAIADWDSIEDYLIIRGGHRWDLNVEAQRISMAGRSVGESRNSSNSYLMIWRSVTSNVTTLSQVTRNLNLEFKAIWLQTVMELIQCLHQMEHL
jgi:hypothetical protein